MAGQFESINIHITGGRYDGLRLRVEMPAAAERIKIKTKILEEATQVKPDDQLPEYTYLEIPREARN